MSGRGVVTIVALGDSTTAGTPLFLSPLEAPPDGRGDERSQFAYWLMQWHPDWRVLNRGVNGERSDQIQARFMRDVVADQPPVVVIIAGVNDVYQGRTPESVTDALRAMYTLARDRGIRVVAGTIVPYNTATDVQNANMRTINAWLARTAREDTNVWFCDTRGAVADPANPDRLADPPDGLHPSAQGYRAMADALRPVIRAALAGQRQVAHRR